LTWWVEAESTSTRRWRKVRNVMRKTLVTAGIAVALAVGPGIGMANAAPTQLPIPPLPEVPLPALPEVPVPALPELALPALPL
jgi:hypothetical protein